MRTKVDPPFHVWHEACFNLREQRKKITMTRFTFPFVLIAAVSMSTPIAAQTNESQPNAPATTVQCNHDDDRHANHCTSSREERRRIAAETRMLENRARRDRAQTRMINAQRELAREEQQRVQAERRAILSEAKQREWDHRRANVSLDNLSMNLGRYHTVVLTSVTGVDIKHTVAQAHHILSQNNLLEFVNPLKIKRKFRTHKRLKADFTHQSGVLQASLHREVLNEYGRFVRLVVRNHTGNIVYDARYENVHFGEMLAPLQGMASL